MMPEGTFKMPWRKKQQQQSLKAVRNHQLFCKRQPSARAGQGQLKFSNQNNPSRSFLGKGRQPLSHPPHTGFTPAYVTCSHGITATQRQDTSINGHTTKRIEFSPETSRSKAIEFSPETSRSKAIEFSHEINGHTTKRIEFSPETCTGASLQSPPGQSSPKSSWSVMANFQQSRPCPCGGS
jgi:hypothetical protein